MGVIIELTKQLKILCREKASVFMSPFDLCKSTVRGLGIKSAEVGEINLQIVPWSNSYSQQENHNITVEANLRSVIDRSTVQAKSKRKKGCVYEYIIEYTPTTRGCHILEVTVNCQPVAGSPFSVVVKTPPTEIDWPLSTL